MRRHSFRPRLEQLEDRWVPTLVLGVDGTGHLTSVTAADNSQTDNLTLTVEPGNTLDVAEGNTDYGTLPVAAHLAISLGANSAGFVNRLDLNNLTLTSNVSVTLGDMPGVNQFRLTTQRALSSGSSEGTLAGTYTVQGGNTGSETVAFGESGALSGCARTININGTVYIDMGLGGQDPSSGPPDAVFTAGGPSATDPAHNTILNVHGDFTMKNSTVFTLRGLVTGNLVSDSSGKAVGQVVALGNFSEPFEVDGNVSVKMGLPMATASLAHPSFETQAALIKGDTNVQLGDGNNVVLLTSDRDLTSTIPSRFLGNLTINGTGNGTTAVTISAAEVQGDVNISATSDVVGALDTTAAVSGKGNVTLTAAQSITVGGLTAKDGNITLTGNLVLIAGNVTSVSGAIALDGTGNLNLGGVEISDGEVASQHGAIDITGASGQSGTGVDIAGAVRSVDGAIRITGTGGTSINGGDGVSVRGEVSSTGSGTGAAPITITGIAGQGDGDGHGVTVAGVVRSLDGAIAITGTGGSILDGVMVSGEVSSAGIGTGASITITGTGGQGGGIGVDIASGVVTALNGAITIAGTGGLNGFAVGGGGGVLVEAFGQVSSTGNTTGATIAITGTGGADGGIGVDIASGTVTARDPIVITGTGVTGPGSSDNNTGVVVSGKVTSTGNAVAGTTTAITITGTGGQGGGIGVDVRVHGEVTSETGAISITGTGGSAPDAFGVDVTAGGRLTSPHQVSITAPSGGVSLLGSVSGQVVAVTGGAGNDTLTIGLSPGPGGFTVDGGGGSDTLAVIEAGILGQDAVGVDPSALTSTGAGGRFIDYQNIASLSITGSGNGGHTFDVVPATNMTISIDGGSPFLSALSAINLHGQFIRTGMSPGRFSPLGQADVLFSNIGQTFVRGDAVDGFAGPDKGDRGMLTGLDATRRFVRALYLDVLGRPGSNSELDLWFNLYNNTPGTQTQKQMAVASGIENSFEGRDHLVKSWYIAFLGRVANGTEEQPFVNELSAGQTEEQVLGQVLGSQEFFNRAGVLVSSGTPNERYVQALYQLLLDRIASAPEVASQVANLKADSASAQGQRERQTLAQAFLRSVEFRADQFLGYYEALLDRPPSTDPSSADQLFLASLIPSGQDVHTARLALESGVEFFSNG
jgi:hypothetical protein